MKNKVLIALVGNQTMPIYLGINEMEPDHIILICSLSTSRQASLIASDFAEKAEMVEMEPVDMMQIVPAARKLLDGLADADVAVNLTSGTKAWAIAFTLIAQGRENVHLIYIDQNCTFYDYTTMKEWLSQTNLSMQQLMRINGQEPKSHTLLADYDDDDMEVLAEVKELRRMSYHNFSSLTIPDKSWKRAFDGGNEGTHCLNDGSFIEWKKSTHHVHIVMRKGCKWIEKELESPHAIRIVFNSGWFEYEVAEMMSHWTHAQEVWLNVVYPYRTGLPKNEIDIVVNTGVKLLMIECKTQIFDNTDIDKFNTAVKNYGGMGCKALFVTESLMKDAAREKCADSHVLAFCIKEYTTMSAAQKHLFSMLDRELFNINAK